MLRVFVRVGHFIQAPFPVLVTCFCSCTTIHSGAISKPDNAATRAVKQDAIKKEKKKGKVGLCKSAKNGTTYCAKVGVDTLVWHGSQTGAPWYISSDLGAANIHKMVLLLFFAGSFAHV